MQAKRQQPGLSVLLHQITHGVSHLQVLVHGVGAGASARQQDQPAEVAADTSGRAVWTLWEQVSLRREVEN